MVTPQKASPAPSQGMPENCSPGRIDVRGRSDPISVVAAKEAVTRAAPGDSVEVLCDVPTCVSLTALCRSRNWPHRVTESDDGGIRLVIEKPLGP